MQGWGFHESGAAKRIRMKASEPKPHPPRLAATPLSGVRDPDDRWPMEGVAVGVERRPVHRLIACAARPRHVPAAVLRSTVTRTRSPRNSSKPS